MRHEFIHLDSGRIYIVNIPDVASEGIMDERDKIILELYHKINRIGLNVNSCKHTWFQDVNTTALQWKCSKCGLWKFPNCA